MKNFAVGLAALLTLVGAGRPALSVTVRQLDMASGTPSAVDAPAGAALAIHMPPALGLARPDHDGSGNPYATVDDSPGLPDRAVAPTEDRDTDIGDGWAASPASEKETAFGDQTPGRAPAQPDLGANEVDGASGGLSLSGIESLRSDEGWAKADEPLSQTWHSLDGVGIVSAPVQRVSSAGDADGSHVAVPARTTAEFMAMMLVYLGLGGSALIGVGFLIYSRCIEPRMYRTSQPGPLQIPPPRSETR